MAVIVTLVRREKIQIENRIRCKKNVVERSKNAEEIFIAIFSFQNQFRGARHRNGAKR